MRKQDNQTQPFEVIEDEHGSYTSGADLVRPVNEAEEPRSRRRPFLLLIWIAVIVIIGLIFVLPAIDREMMRSTMVRMIGAVNGRDFDALENSFTPDAKIGVQEFTFKVSEAISEIKPFLSQYDGTGNLRFTGFTDLSRFGKGVYEADFTVKFNVNDESIPYNNMAITKKGHVRLRRMGWFRWKIAYLTSDEDDFNEALNGLLLRKSLPW